ncbi:unnamed protein product [Pleuronectes platessa]|uniref:Uncharacterized protein n=1 Tax=Pleuronectes platessa TaxID=8262 RepID=A0A9N7Y738_PLEPL|nr:unnamed protein product [Pleuronectes platessa]
MKTVVLFDSSSSNPENKSQAQFLVTNCVRAGYSRHEYGIIGAVDHLPCGKPQPPISPEQFGWPLEARLIGSKLRHLKKARRTEEEKEAALIVMELGGGLGAGVGWQWHSQ